MKNTFSQQNLMKWRRFKFLQISSMSVLMEDGLILMSASAFDRLLYIGLVEDEENLAL